MGVVGHAVVGGFHRSRAAFDQVQKLGVFKAPALDCVGQVWASLSSENLNGFRCGAGNIWTGRDLVQRFLKFHTGVFALCAPGADRLFHARERNLGVHAAFFPLGENSDRGRRIKAQRTHWRAVFRYVGSEGVNTDAGCLGGHGQLIQQCAVVVRLYARVAHCARYQLHRLHSVGSCDFRKFQKLSCASLGGLVRVAEAGVYLAQRGAYRVKVRSKRGRHVFIGLFQGFGSLSRRARGFYHVVRAVVYLVPCSHRSSASGHGSAGHDVGRFLGFLQLVRYLVKPFCKLVQGGVFQLFVGVLQRFLQLQGCFLAVVFGYRSLLELALGTADLAVQLFLLAFQVFHLFCQLLGAVAVLARGLFLCLIGGLCGLQLGRQLLLAAFLVAQHFG